MKTLLTIILIALTFGLSAQTLDEETTKNVKEFLSCRSIEFNKGIEPVYVADFETVADSISKTQTNYTLSVHMFYGPAVHADSWMGLSCKSRGGGVAQKFIKYAVKRSENVTYLMVLFGNDGW